VPTDSGPILAHTITAAERALTVAWGTTADLLPLDPVEAVRTRSVVARCLVRTQYVDAPPTVIVKTFRGYDVNDRTPESAAGRLLNEWAALEFLSSTNVAPRLYAANRDDGVLVIEDLGAGASLIDRLNQPDRVAAEQALSAYARGLAALHAHTSNQASAPRDPFVTAWPARNLPPLRSILTDLGLGWTTRTQEELDTVVHVVAEAHDLLALSQGDTCPENHRLTADGVRFLDFEFCGFRHALLDVAFLRLPFPTCQDVQRLPVEAVDQALAAYRAQLNFDHFASQLDIAQAWWTMLSLGAYLPRALGEDQLVGTATMRQRLLLWLETFGTYIQSLPALHTLARDARELLHQRWQCEDLAFYSAFRT
jgi:Ser/Thr protein kinase RdoA (MazF antagonist)